MNRRMVDTLTWTPMPWTMSLIEQNGLLKMNLLTECNFLLFNFGFGPRLRSSRPFLNTF